MRRKLNIPNHLKISGLSALIAFGSLFTGEDETLKAKIYNSPRITITAPSSISYANKENAFGCYFDHENIKHTNRVYQMYLDELYTINPGLEYGNYKTIKMPDPDGNGRVG